MGLRAQAAADLSTIVTDQDGFGWPITVTDPDGASAALVGLSTDHSTTIDPETGAPIAGRECSVALAIASLTAAGMALPKGSSELSGMPWRVSFDDTAGNAQLYKVVESVPDRAVGIVVLKLEFFGA